MSELKWRPSSVEDAQRIHAWSTASTTLAFKNTEGKIIRRDLMCCYVVQSRSVISIIVIALIFGYWIGRIFWREKEKDQTGTRRRSVASRATNAWCIGCMSASVYLGQHSDMAVGRSILKLSCLSKKQIRMSLSHLASTSHYQGKKNEQTKHIPDRPRGREETGRRRK